MICQSVYFVLLLINKECVNLLCASASGGVILRSQVMITNEVKVIWSNNEVKGQGHSVHHAASSLRNSLITCE